MWDAHRTLIRPSDGFPAKVPAVPDQTFPSPLTQLLSSYTPTARLPLPSLSPSHPDSAGSVKPLYQPHSPCSFAHQPLPPPDRPRNPSVTSSSRVVQPPSLTRPQIPIPPDVYSHIISFLRRPLPPPNGRNPHAAIRQPDLAKMMRVSVLCNNLVASSLYTVVVVDDLSLFAYNVGEPSSAEGIPAKAELVGLTRRLYLEYRESREPTYLQIMQHGREAYSQMCPGHHERGAVSRDNAIDIANAVQRFQDALSLTSVSSSIFLGAPSSDLPPDLEDPCLADVKTAVAYGWRAVSSLHVEPHPTHFCHRGIRGSLSFLSTSTPPMTLPSGEPQTHFVHIDTDSNSTYIPVLVGGHTHCYVSFDRWGDPGIKAGMVLLMNVIRSQLRMREQVMKESRAGRVPRDASNDYISIDFYVPIAWTEDSRWKYAPLEVAKRINEFRAELEVPPSSYPRDSLRLKRLDEDTPACLCCLWSSADVSVPQTTNVTSGEMEDPGGWYWD